MWHSIARPADMPEQPIVDYADFVARVKKKKWNKDRVLREAYEWRQQADLIRRALQQLMHVNVTLVATNDHLIDLLQRLNAVDLIESAVLEQYKSLRMNEICEGESLIRQGMELNADLAATTAVSEKQKHAAGHPRSRSDNVRNPVIKAMRTWRRRPGVTLYDFIAAHADSVVGIRISNPTPTNGERYTVDRYDDAGKKVAGKPAPLRTLQGWWTSAGKPKPSKH